MPAWLASVMHVAREELVFESEREIHDERRITYARAGVPIAIVTLAAMQMSHSHGAAWQLVARIGDRVDQVQVPAHTRFVWR